MCLCFEVLKGTHWWWHSSPEWDNRDLLTQHLGALPSPIKTYKPSFTHCEWPACHSTHSLLIPLPTTLIYSHHRSPVLSLSGECKHTGRCRGHLRPMCSLIGPHSRKPCVLLCLWMCVRVCVCFFMILYRRKIITGRSLGTAMCSGVMNTMGCFLCLCV